MQDCSNSIANALVLLQSCNKPSIWAPRHLLPSALTVQLVTQAKEISVKSLLYQPFYFDNPLVSLCRECTENQWILQTNDQQCRKCVHVIMLKWFPSYWCNTVWCICSWDYKFQSPLPAKQNLCYELVKHKICMDCSSFDLNEIKGGTNLCNRTFLLGLFSLLILIKLKLLCYEPEHSCTFWAVFL